MQVIKYLMRVWTPGNVSEEDAGAGCLRRVYCLIYSSEFTELKEDIKWDYFLVKCVNRRNK